MIRRQLKPARKATDHRGKPVCPCGEPAVRWDAGAWACVHCLAIEATLPIDFEAGRNPKPESASK